MKKPELLAPAGSFEKAKIAYLYGADAVYCGTSSLSLRSRAAIDDYDLFKTIEYAHSIGKKIYVAMNIYAFDTDYEEVENMCKKLEKIKPDGIIAADPGVISKILKYAPSVTVNVSTQANLVSLEACKFWYNQGCKRMILARELSKDQIKYIMENKPEGMEVEIFIHGAICFSYSGRCFLSDFLCGRSANYGSCAQSCRWTYDIYLEERNNPGNLMPVELDEHGTSILSSKDLCLINELPEIINMGVDSLKIEGRLKTEYYIASIVSIYRAAIDDYFENPENYNSEKYMKEIEKIKTRGLTTFYFNSRENKDIQEYEGKQYNVDYEFGGKVVKYDDVMSTIEIRNKLSISDELELIIPGKLEPIKFKIDRLWDAETEEEIDTVNPGKKSQQVKMKLPIKAEENWILRRKK